jgi:signal transduction histidine kinase
MCNIEIEIRDTGVGISEDELPKLCKLFGNLDVKNNLNKAGSGLGLDLSKKIIESLGGKVNIYSEEGVGTQVKFNFKTPGRFLDNSLVC